MACNVHGLSVSKPSSAFRADWTTSPPAHKGMLSIQYSLFSMMTFSILVMHGCVNERLNEEHAIAPRIEYNVKRPRNDNEKQTQNRERIFARDSGCKHGLHVSGR